MSFSQKETNQSKKALYFLQKREIINTMSSITTNPLLQLCDPLNSGELVLSDCDKEEFDLHHFALWNALIAVHKHQQSILQEQLNGSVGGGNNSPTITGKASGGSESSSSHHHHDKSGGIFAALLSEEINSSTTTNSCT